MSNAQVWYTLISSTVLVFFAMIEVAAAIQGRREANQPVPYTVQHVGADQDVSQFPQWGPNGTL